MSVQLSVAARNARLDAIETTVGVSAKLRIYTGSPPANCAASATGTLLADLALPSDYLAAASGGVKSKSGTWSDASADGTGTAGYYRLLDTAGTTCHAQGTVTLTGGGGDLTVDGTFTAGQVFTISTFGFTDANA